MNFTPLPPLISARQISYLNFLLVERDIMTRRALWELTRDEASELIEVLLNPEEWPRRSDLLTGFSASKVLNGQSFMEEAEKGHGE